MGYEENAASKEDDKQNMQLLEDALVHCKVGKFHVLLMFGVTLVAFSNIMVPTTLSFVLPIAECDLDMSLMEKGVVSAMPFVGQLLASIIIGFLSDAFGRKYFIAYGLLAIFVCQVVGALSQNTWTLGSTKFLDGIFTTFHYPSAIVMMAEMIHKNARDKFMSIKTVLTSLPLIVTPLLSWAILPQKWDIVVIEGYLELHSWNFYLLLCSLSSLVGGLVFLYLPESPKYLLTHGKEDEALVVLKKIYSMNTGNHMDTFPVTTLKTGNIENPHKEKSRIFTFKNQVVKAMFDVKSLFRRPLLGRLLLFCAIAFNAMITFNGLRPWFPQITTIAEKYTREHNQTDKFCTMINEYTDSLTKNKHFEADFTAVNSSSICIPDISGSDTYISGVILGVTSLFLMGITSYVIEWIGMKPVMFFLLVLPAACLVAIYWVSSLIGIAVILALISGFMQTMFSFMINISCQVFPTTLRALSNTLIVMAGRIGSVVGSLMFPVLLRMGCMIPFGVMALLMLCIVGLVFFIPNTKDESGEN